MIISFGQPFWLLTLPHSCYWQPRAFSSGFWIENEQHHFLAKPLFAISWTNHSCLACPPSFLPVVFQYPSVTGYFISPTADAVVFDFVAIKPSLASVVVTNKALIMYQHLSGPFVVETDWFAVQAAATCNSTISLLILNFVSFNVKCPQQILAYLESLTFAIYQRPTSVDNQLIIICVDANFDFIKFVSVADVFPIVFSFATLDHVNGAWSRRRRGRGYRIVRTIQEKYVSFSETEQWTRTICSPRLVDGLSFLTTPFLLSLMSTFYEHMNIKIANETCDVLTIMASVWKPPFVAIECIKLEFGNA